MSINNSLNTMGTAMKQVSVPVSSAEFKDLVANPKLLVAAGGANIAHLLSSVFIEYHYGSVAYTTGTDFYVCYGTSMSAPAMSVVSWTTFLIEDDLSFLLNKYSAVTAAYVGSTLSNNGLYLVPDGVVDFADGDGDLIVHLTYETIMTSF